MADQNVSLGEYMDNRLAEAQGLLGMVRNGLQRGLVGTTIMDLEEFALFLSGAQKAIILVETGVMALALGCKREADDAA